MMGLGFRSRQYRATTFRFLFIMVALGMLSQAAGQQINPAQDRLFQEAEVTEIHVTLTEADKDFLLDNANRNSEEYVTADVRFTNSKLQNARVTNVGIRLRGNTSRGHLKRSFKIDFQEFGGERFLGHKKINLKPNVNDPSLVRELLTMHLYRQMSVPAARITPAALFFNEEYMGVYLMVEQIDDEFIDRRFGHEDGFLYKCRFGATLENDGQILRESLYESKMNEESDHRQELSHFIETLNSASVDDLQEEIRQVFHVDRYIRQLAVEAITGHWDGYSYLNNNFYLFYDERSGKFEFIPYDTDNTWGIDWIGGDWATRDLKYFRRSGHPRPLTVKILNVPDWRIRYYACLNKVTQLYFNENEVLPLLDQLEEVLDPYVEMDDKFSDSFGFSYDDFKASFHSQENQQVKYGLRDFLHVRRTTGLASIPEVDTELCTFSDVSVFPNPSPNGVFRVISKEDPSPKITVLDQYGKRVPFGLTQVQNNPTLYLDEPGLYIVQVNSKVIRVMVE